MEGLVFTSRREIGHGRLARRGVAAVLPSESEFPYAMRVVSKLLSLMAPVQWPQFVVQAWH